MLISNNSLKASRSLQARVSRLDRATHLGRIPFSYDDDLLAIARRRQSDSVEFAGLIHGQQLDLSSGQAIRDLELIAQVYEAADIKPSRVHPL
jgi:hypothetical protein